MYAAQDCKGVTSLLRKTAFSAMTASICLKATYISTPFSSLHRSYIPASNHTSLLTVNAKTMANAWTTLCSLELAAKERRPLVDHLLSKYL